MEIIEDVRVIVDAWGIEAVKFNTDCWFKVPLNDDECWQVLLLMAEKNTYEYGLGLPLMNNCVYQLFKDRELFGDEIFYMNSKGELKWRKRKVIA